MAKDYKKNLQKRLNLKNINAVPTLETVIVNMGIWSIVTRKWHKDFEEFEKNLSKITWQKPRIVKAKKSISNFKLREWMPVMLQSTLRGNRALDFIDRLYKIILPRIRDFSWLNKRSFDSQANLTIGIKNYSIFPELGLDDVIILKWIGIIIVISTNNQEKSIALLEELGFVFK